MASEAPRYPRAFGAGAGLLAVGLILGLIGGVAWGFVRPTYTVSFQDGAAVVDPAASAPSADFAAIGWLAIITAALGVILAAVALLQTRKGEVAGGFSELVWLILVAGATSLTTFAVGEMTVRALYPVPSHSETPTTEPFALAPSVEPHVALLVAPLVAAAMFWMANFFELTRLTREQARVEARSEAPALGA